jgi:hypothetical protein
MNNVFRAKFPAWEMGLALSPRELAYEIVLGMNEKMRQSAKINWDANGLAKGIASGYADTPEYRRVVMEGIELMFAMGLLTNSASTGNPYVFLSRTGLALRTGEDVAAHRARNLEAQALLDERIRENTLDAVSQRRLRHRDCVRVQTR